MNRIEHLWWSAFAGGATLAAIVVGAMALTVRSGEPAVVAAEPTSARPLPTVEPVTATPTSARPLPTVTALVTPTSARTVTP